MMADTESQSLKGNVVTHPSFITPYDTPTFLRAAMLRVIAGFMALAACVSFCTALVVQTNEDRLSCAFAFATCAVAFYHYQKLISIREQTGVRVKLAKPGDVPMGQATELKLAWQELSCDAVRYSDWAVTLLPLIIDLHMIVDKHTALFSIAWSGMLVQVMVALGAFTRLGTDELVPRRDGKGVDAMMVIGLLAFFLSCGCLALVLYNLLGDLESDPSNGWVYAFSLPWILYGVVAIASIVWRQFQSRGYPEALSIFKDVAYGFLDVWSKATFALWICSKALGVNDVLFGV
jgi:bacteriorhodopsin